MAFLALVSEGVLTDGGIPKQTGLSESPGSAPSPRVSSSHLPMDGSGELKCPLTAQSSTLPPLRLTGYCPRKTTGLLQPAPPETTSLCFSRSAVMVLELI